MQRIAIIPAYEPPDAFVSYAAALCRGVDHLVVVNDGSSSQFDPVFSKISQIDKATVLSYPENRGKGHALKTAFTHCACHYSQEDILVTADCDGQHDPEDVLAVCEEAEDHPNACVLGCRDFSQKNVPKRSRTGNTNMLRLLRWMYGIRISDSQTGLRAFTVATAQRLIHVKGDRFEYETGMLIYAQRNHIPFREVAIHTIYPEHAEDHESHFRTFRDSLRILWVLLRYLWYSAYHIYGPFARFARWLLRSFSREYRCDFEIPQEPVVFVCRHLDMHGPYTTLKWLPTEPHPLVMHMFFDRKTTVRHMTEYTFSARYGKKSRKFSPAAHIMGWIMPPLTKSLQAVPVYRGGTQAMTTIKQGLKYLLKSECLIVFPDIRYTDDYDKPSDIYEGFLSMGELYFKKTGKPLSFVPLRIDDENRRIVAGDPVRVTRFREECSAAAAYLKAQINWNK